MLESKMNKRNSLCINLLVMGKKNRLKPVLIISL